MSVNMNRTTEFCDASFIDRLIRIGSRHAGKLHLSKTPSIHATGARGGFLRALAILNKDVYYVWQRPKALLNAASILGRLGLDIGRPSHFQFQDPADRCAHFLWVLSILDSNMGFRRNRLRRRTVPKGWIRPVRVGSGRLAREFGTQPAARTFPPYYSNYHTQTGHITMRRLLAKIIVAFANLIVSPLSPNRQRDAKVMARDLLAPTFPVETERGRLLFDPSSRKCFRRAWRFNSDEPDTLAWIDALPDDSCLWDVGANIGVFSLYAGLRPKARVLAFEPSGSSFAVLNRNIELNNIPDRVVAYCIAFSEKSVLDVLNMTVTTAGHSMHGFGTKVDQFDKSIDTKFCQGTIGFSIDDFVTMFSPPLPTHLKIDVDGIEADILRGGLNTLSARSVKSMIVEIQGDPGLPRNQQVLAIMAELGFSARPKASLAFRNVIFDRSPS